MKSWLDSFPVELKFRKERVPAREYLDCEGTPDVYRRQSLEDLRRIGKWPGMRGAVLAEVERLIYDCGGRTLRTIRILEIGCGAGDLGRWIAHRLAAKGFAVALMLSDLRLEHIVNRMRPQTHHFQESRIGCDILKDELPAHDICLMHLVLHHFSQAQIDFILAKLMHSANCGGVVSDLERHPVPFYFIRMAFPFLVASPITVADALLSVQQGFSKSEWRALQASHARSDVQISTRFCFPFRVLMRWRRP